MYAARPVVLEILWFVCTHCGPTGCVRDSVVRMYTNHSLHMYAAQPVVLEIQWFVCTHCGPTGCVRDSVVRMYTLRPDRLC